MKDVQIEFASENHRIPFVSAGLHLCSMTVLVFLRSSFGFAYLRPKSVFFAFSWAFVLFAIYAYNEPGVWKEYRAVCVFGVASMALYWIHLCITLTREWTEKWHHDRFSGSSHIVSLLGAFGRESTYRLIENVQVWAEPAAVLLAAALLRAFGEHHLSAWLAFAAACLWLKEVLNCWFDLRYRKRNRDTFENAASIDIPEQTAVERRAPIAARKQATKRRRNFTSTTDD